MTPLEAITLCAAAEAAYNPSNLTPPLSPELAQDWAICGYISGVDNWPAWRQSPTRVFYGWVLQSKATGEYGRIVRGTENAQEWLIDGEAVLTTLSELPSLPSCGTWQPLRLPRVHLGFSSVSSTLRSTFTVPNNVPCTDSGHSLGAPLAAYMTYIRGGSKALLFAMPKPGDAGFAQDFDSIVGKNNYTVYNYEPDLVPTLPYEGIGIFDFRQLSNVVVIPRSDSIADNIIANHQASNYAKLIAALPQTTV